MALMALMGQIGPSLRDFAGEYEWHPSPPPPLTESSELTIIDDNTIEWTDTKGGVSAVYRRDTTHPTWFVGIGGTGGCCKYDNTGDVWVLDAPNRPLGFRDKKADAAAAPTVTAMNRDPPGGYATQEKRSGQESAMQALERKAAKMTPAMQEREAKKYEKEQKQAAEMMAIKEGIANDRAARRDLAA